MSFKIKVCLIFLLSAFFSIQFYLTVFGGFFWPFCSYRLFSQYPDDQKQIIQVLVEDSEGNSYSVHPGAVIPIEYCRCSSLVRSIFINGQPEQKVLFYRYLIQRLNEQPWGTFDEVFASVQSPNGSLLTRLKFEMHTIHFQDYHYPFPLPIRQQEDIYP